MQVSTSLDSVFPPVKFTVKERYKEAPVTESQSNADGVHFCFTVYPGAGRGRKQPNSGAGLPSSSSCRSRRRYLLSGTSKRQRSRYSANRSDILPVPGGRAPRPPRNPAISAPSPPEPCAPSPSGDRAPGCVRPPLPGRR